MSNVSRGKGFMHAIEGIIASILLISYTATVIQYPYINDDWADVKNEQSSREFLSALNDAGLSYLIVDDRAAEFSAIAKNMLGGGKGYGLYTDGLLPRNVILGVMTNYSERIVLNPVDCSDYGVPYDPACSDDCYESSFMGHWFLLTDNDTNAPNGECDYDSIYFDGDDDSSFEPFEGPKFVGGTVNVSNSVWIFGSVNRGPVSVDFSDGTGYMAVRNNINDVFLNGRRTNITFRSVTNRSNYGDIDVLVVPQYIVLSDIKERLVGYLDNGGSIVEIADIDSGNMDDVQTDVFGIQAVGYGVSAGSNELSLREPDEPDPAYETTKYFLNSDIDVDTGSFVYSIDNVWSGNEYDCYISTLGHYLGHVTCTAGGADPCATYVITGILGYVDRTATPPIWCKIGDEDGAMRYFYGYFDVRGVEYFGMIVNSSGEGYDELYIDRDFDFDLTNDGGPFEVGDVFSLGTEQYELSAIYGRFRGFSLRAVQGHSFAGQVPTEVYSIMNDTSFVVLEQGREFYTTALDTGDVETASSFSAAGVCTTSVRASEYLHADPWSLPYDFTIANVSREFNMFLLDLNGDGDCNDGGEGPYYSGDVVRIGPEYYLVDIEPDGSEARWTFVDRWNVPFATVFHKNGLRRAVWIHGGISSLDEWQFVRSAIIWAADKNSDLLKSSSSFSSVLVKTTLVVDRDFFQPYKVFFRSGG